MRRSPAHPPSAIHAVLIALALSLVLAGCAAGEDIGPPANDHGRSQTCLTMEKSLCDWDADRCHNDTRASCDDSAQSLFCVSDDKLKPCIDALALATNCAASPVECAGLNDPAPAIAFCNQLLDTYCQAEEKCGRGTKADCITSAGVDLSCDTAIGVGPTSDACLAAMPTQDCTATTLPASCTGVVRGR